MKAVNLLSTVSYYWREQEKLRQSSLWIVTRS